MSRRWSAFRGVRIAGALATLVPGPLAFAVDAPTPVAEPASVTAPLGDGITLSADFPGGRVDGVERTGPMSFRLRIVCEAEPIHESPWYSFAVDMVRPGRVTFELAYPQTVHRYAPKFSADGRHWMHVPDAGVLSEDGHAFRFSIELPAGRTWVAAQDFVPPSDFDQLLGELRGVAGGEVVTAGRSVAGREIRAWVRPPSKGSDWVVVTGGQHPPEVPGVRGLMPFARTLARNVAAGELPVGLIVIPLINPDGLWDGHWRFNLHGRDLNRTWKTGAFEPETEAVTRFILARLAEAGGRARFFVDFHATQKDVFYTFPDEVEGDAGTTLKRAWLTGIARRVPDFTLREKTGHNPGQPVSRVWALENLGCPALTFEFGDETDRALITRTTEAAAEELTELLKRQ